MTDLFNKTGINAEIFNKTPYGGPNMTCRVFVTIDLDWASEHVIEETLQWFETANIPVMLCYA